jgi:putative transcriptional regulator
MSRTGKLLIAHPNLPVENPFYKSVIYVLEDGPDGTQGIILNKPSEFNISQFFRAKSFDFPLTKETLRFGGPVKTNIIVMLHSDGWYSSSTDYIQNGVALSCDDFMLEKMSMGDIPNQWRMFMGVCAWAPGQLDMELAGKYPYTPENSWLIAEADTDIIFNSDSQRQWEKALTRSSQEMINYYF